MHSVSTVNRRLLNALAVTITFFVVLILVYLFTSNNKEGSLSIYSTENLESTHSETALVKTDLILLFNIQLFDSSQFSTRFARRSRQLEVLTQADVYALKKLWTEAKSIDTPNFKKEIQSNIIRRWSVIDPVEALSVALKLPLDEHQRDLIKLVFLEWSLASLDEALESVASLDQANKEAAISGMIVALEHLSLSERREIARELDCEWIAIEVLRHLTAGPVIENPVEEWNNFFEKNGETILDLSLSQFKMLSNLVYAWVLLDGIEAIDSIRNDLPENFSLYSTVELVASKLMHGEPRLALELVVAQANRENDKKFQELAVELISNWAESDAIAALDATFIVEARSLRRELQNRVLEESARIDADSLLSNLRNLPEDLRHRAHELALIAIAKRSPETVATKLGELDLRDHRDRVAEAVAVHWGERDIASALHWINTNVHVAHSREDLTETALRALARKDPQLAFDAAVALPLNTDGQGWEGRVIYELLLVDTDSAIPLIPQTRAGSTRRDAFDWAILMSLTWEQDVVQAINLLTEMCEVEPKGTKYSTGFLTSKAPRQVFDALDNISSVMARAELAESLLRNNADNGVFSVQELEILEIIEQSKSKQETSLRVIEAAENMRSVQQAEKAD